jgi:nucleoside-diphosphate-sugar epimerase
MTHHLVCVGMGYSARALGQRLAGSMWTIAGTATRAESLARVAASGWQATPFDGTARSAELSDQLARATHVVMSAAPGEAGDALLRWHGADLASAPHLRWIGYLSTVGVYGDHQGSWIDEDTAVRPTSVRSRQRAMAETAWLDFARSSGKRVQIFRLAGIYGPGRSAVDNLRDGTARRIIKPAQVFNRIHVVDIAGTLMAAIDRPTAAHAIYNVTDDEPAPPQDVVEFAAHQLGMPVPPDIPFAEAQLSEMGRSFYAENKRVSNARIKADLAAVLRYPTYREGMTALAAAPRS